MQFGTDRVFGTGYHRELSKIATRCFVAGAVPQPDIAKAKAVPILKLFLDIEKRRLICEFINYLRANGCPKSRKRWPVSKSGHPICGIGAAPKHAMRLPNLLSFKKVDPNARPAWPKASFAAQHLHSGRMAAYSEIIHLDV
jgi:hypothetical protein